MIENEKVITEGIITEMNYYYDKKMKNETWYYKYEFKVNKESYRNELSFANKKYKKNDTIKLKYCKSYPRFSKIIENDANTNRKLMVE